MMVTSGLSRLEGLGDSVSPGWANEAVVAQRDPSQVAVVEGVLPTPCPPPISATTPQTGQTTQPKAPSLTTQSFTFSISPCPLFFLMWTILTAY